MSCLCLFADSFMPFSSSDDSDRIALWAFRIDKK